MESPVVVDKPPEYHGNDRGFPFEEEEGSGAWSELAARHPDIAARLRQRPATWARKRRPSSHDATDDFGDSFGGFDRFPFDDIPPEFREHFPSHWNRRFGSRDEPQETQTSSPQPHQHTTATQTEQDQDIGPEEHDQQTPLPQYGLRNTVDLGQKSPADPSLVDADERAHRSMSAPPDTPNQTKMSGHNHQEQGHAPQHNEQTSNVRHIPIFVEGRDEPVINKSVDHGAHYPDSKPTYVPPPPQPHVDRDQYFADDGPVTFHPPPNFSRAFGTPFNKGFRQGPQPFVQQKVYPQTAYARATSPQRGQSPKPQPHVDEHYVKVPVHHEHATPKTEAPSRAQKSPQKQQAPPRQQQQVPPQQQQQQVPSREPTPPKPQPPSANDPITLILSIQTDVLNLMTEVENFKGAKNDKQYLFLDEMLTRNLIKLDNIETDGKENIRQARKEAIKCIQKCIAVLEAKAESNSAQQRSEAVPQQEPVVQQETQSQPQDVEMKENNDVQENVSHAPAVDEVTQNGEVDMKDAKEVNTTESEPVAPEVEVTPAVQEDQAIASKQEKTEPKIQEKLEDTLTENKEIVTTGNKEVAQPQAADTRPVENKVSEEQTVPNVEHKDEEKDKKSNPKKVTKTAKKRDKSKDKKEESKDSNKEEKAEEKQNETEQKEKLESMQVDDKGDKTDSQVMEVDGAASQ